MTRRDLFLTPAAAAAASASTTRAPIVNAAEHAWVLYDPRFPIDPALATCPSNLPKHEYAAEFLLAEMKTYGIDHVVISHVCYYGRNNAYASYCVKKIGRAHV